MKSRTPDGEEEQLKEAFRAMDTDGNGFITAEDLRDLLESEGVTSEDVREMIGDGVGENVGESVGELVGENVGDSVGELVGELVGLSVGADVKQVKLPGELTQV